MVEGMKKHIGQLKNTGVRIAVVFRKLPNDPDHCLIVETERLPDSYHDALFQALNSQAARDTNDFFEVLNARTFPDGTNCLTSLHQRGFLRKEPISNIEMLPLPGKKVDLGLINATIDKKVEEYNKKQNEEATKAKVSAEAAETESNDPAAIAKGLILQAEMLEKEAATKREEAYALAPDLKPGRGRPSLAEDVRAEKLEERKVKRRERDQRNAAAAKVEKVEAALDAKVEAKLQRDSVRTPEQTKIVEAPEPKVKGKKTKVVDSVGQKV